MRVLIATHLLIFFTILSCSQNHTIPYNARGNIAGEVTATSAIIHVRLTKNPARNPTTRFWTWDDQFTALPYSEDLPEAVPGAAGWVRVIYGFDKVLDDAQKTGWKEASARSDFNVQFDITELSPSTRYYYRAEISADRQPNSTRMSELHSFTTAPAEDQFSHVNFTVITGTAMRSRDIWKDGQPWGFKSFVAMNRLQPDFFVHTGDIVYYDSDSPLGTNKELARFHWSRMFSCPTVKDFFQPTACYFIKDDHDYRWNDCWPQQTVPHVNRGTSYYITDEIGRAVFREQVPMGDKTYRTIRWGRGLQIWLVEGRDYRSPNDMPDGPEKSIWGKVQKAWLKRTLLESKALFKILISPTPIVGPDRENKFDNHANSRGFKTEGRSFLDWAANNLTRFFIVCGDRHWQYHSIDSSGVQEFSAGAVSDVHGAVNQPHWGKDRQPFFRDAAGGFLQVRLIGRAEKPDLRFIFYDVDGVPVYVKRFESRGKGTL